MERWLAHMTNDQTLVGSVASLATHPNRLHFRCAKMKRNYDNKILPESNPHGVNPSLNSSALKIFSSILAQCWAKILYDSFMFPVMLTKHSRGHVPQLVDRPSKVPIWCNSDVSSIPGRGLGVRINCGRKKKKYLATPTVWELRN